MAKDASVGGEVRAGTHVRMVLAAYRRKSSVLSLTDGTILHRSFLLSSGFLKLMTGSSFAHASAAG